MGHAKRETEGREDSAPAASAKAARPAAVGTSKALARGRLEGVAVAAGIPEGGDPVAPPRNRAYGPRARQHAHQGAPGAFEPLLRHRARARTPGRQGGQAPG